MRRASGILLLMAAVLVLAAVPAVRGGVAPDPGQAAATGPIILPFDAYRLTGTEQAVVDQALLILAGRCMSSRGLPEVAIPPSVVGGVPDSLGNSRRYGITDQSAARRYGYHLPPDPVSQTNAAALDEWLTGLSEPRRSALYGTEREPGCVEVAHDQLARGAPEANLGWLADLDFESLERSARDPRVVTAIEQWRVCMRREGLHYADPYQAVADPQWDLDAPAVPDREVSAALADVRCKSETGLVGIWTEVEIEIQQELVAADATGFAALVEARDLIVTNAEQVMAGNR